MLFRKVIDIAAPLIEEQRERLKILREMSDEDIVFDEDCMPLSDECHRKNEYIMRKYNTRRVTKEMWMAEFPERFQKHKSEAAG